ncbi:beta-lactamase induction protein [Dyella sp.]|jgi:AmpE protein|uniref:beta-lactamase induction protein n=1 Tax=Dyella sp. TaxID=1869338 RepID=UPI002D79DF77|nr:beta-lactamase induction protein [Dyella sp.]HET6431437.1 beta-lactamase induction protein [Dyella sp.]
MAIRLLAALLALGLLHLLPQLARWHLERPYRRWVSALRDLHGAVRVVVVVGVPMVLCALLAGALQHAPLGDLARLLLDVAVLLACFGPRAFEADLESILAAPDLPARERAAQRLADGGEQVAWNAHALGGAIAFAALRRRFGALWWFFLLGPAGALGYRLVQMLGRDESMPMDAASRSAARHTANALDWVPAQLLVFTLAVVGHWDAVMAAWKRWRQQTRAGDWYRAEPFFLADAACADIDVEIEAGDGYGEERSDPLLELVRMRSAFLRALVAWMSVVALVVMGSWLA